MRAPAMTAVVARILATAALAVGLLCAGQIGVLGFDSTYALVWGNELRQGRLPLMLPAGASTPHPLGVALGTVVEALGLPPGTLVVVSGVAGAGCVVGYAALGARLTRVLIGWLSSALDVKAGAGRGAASRRSNNPSLREGPGRPRSAGRTPARGTRSGYGAAVSGPRTLGWLSIGWQDVGRRMSWSMPATRIASWVSGLVVTVVIVGAPRIWLLAKTGSLDLVFVAAVGWGLLAVDRGRLTLGLVLLTLGSLERPEGWLILVGVVLLSSRARDHAGRPADWDPSGVGGGFVTTRFRSARPSGRWAVPVLTWFAVAPALWAGMGLLFADPLVGIAQTQSNADQLHDPTGFRTAVGRVPGALGSGPGWLAIVLGLVGTLGCAALLVVARLAPSASSSTNMRPTPVRADPILPRLMLVGLAGDIAAFVAAGAVGAAPIARYLLCAALLLTALAGAVVGVSLMLVVQRLPLLPRAIGPVLLIAVAATAVHRTAGFAAVNDVLAFQHSVDRSLRSALNGAKADANRCDTPVTTPVVAQIPAIALQRGELSQARYLRPRERPGVGSGLLLYPRNTAVVYDAGFGPSLRVAPDLPVPAGYREIYLDDRWVAFANC